MIKPSAPRLTAYRLSFRILSLCFFAGRSSAWGGFPDFTVSAPGHPSPPLAISPSGELSLTRRARSWACLLWDASPSPWALASPSCSHCGALRYKSSLPTGTTGAGAPAQHLVTACEWCLWDFTRCRKHGSSDVCTARQAQRSPRLVRGCPVILSWS